MYLSVDMELEEVNIRELQSSDIETHSVDCYWDNLGKDWGILDLVSGQGNLEAFDLGNLVKVVGLGIPEMVAGLGIPEMFADLGIPEMVSDLGILEMVADLGIPEMVADLDNLEMVWMAVDWGSQQMGLGVLVFDLVEGMLQLYCLDMLRVQTFGWEADTLKMFDWVSDRSVVVGNFPEGWRGWDSSVCLDR